MTNTVHTPGPWDYAPSVFNYHNGQQSPSYCIKNDDGYFIAKLHPFNGLPHDLQEAQANARLIAGAPVMLNLLERFIAHGDFLNTPENESLKNMAKSLIDKIRN